ncbi:hypothetical protein [Streptomyces sp. NPDC051577]|uniref:hypothetical protein n=1 Tax=Streptomyces sp. NPDC051577 TaxID=3155166 RepID=UPI00341A2DA4
MTGDPWAGAGLMSHVLIALPAYGAAVAALGTGYLAYRLAKPFTGLVGKYAPIGSFAAAAGGARWGEDSEPLIADALAWSAPWSVLIAPLLVAGAAGCGVWWLVERRAADWHSVGRWPVRIPLATLIVSALLYSPGALL